MTAKTPDVPLIWPIIGATLAVVVGLGFVIALICTFLLWLRDPQHRWPQTTSTRVRVALATAERCQGHHGQPHAHSDNVEPRWRESVTFASQQPISEYAVEGRISGELPSCL
jgi:hypothetical protein